MTENTTTVSLTFDDLMLAIRLRRAQNGPPPSATVGTIAAHALPPGGTDLVDRLRQLCVLAEQSGAGAEWITMTADAVVHAVMDLEKFKRDSIDPRRRRSAAQAHHMANTVRSMREAGLSRGACVAVLRERHGLSRSRIYELLALCPGT